MPDSLHELEIANALDYCDSPGELSVWEEIMLGDEVERAGAFAFLLFEPDLFTGEEGEPIDWEAWDEESAA